MDWNLIIAIAALLTGGGCVIWIFNAGQWKGEVSTKMETFRKDLDKQQETIVGKVESNIGHSTDKVNADAIKAIDVAANQIRTEFRADILRVHERLDEESNLLNTQQVQGRLDALVAGIQAQRQEWDTLRGDVRVLLRAEATTTNEITNFKERLTNFEHKMGVLSEKATRLESDVAHITSDRRK
jgi:predicted  nucleic acid-binding Zn-ribbon protein